MSATDKFVQFSLPALACCPDTKTRLNGILCKWLVDEGARKSEKESLSSAAIRAACDMKYVPSGTDWKKRTHMLLAMGRSTHRVTGGPGAGPDATAALEMEVFIRERAKRFGPDPVARIREDIFWEAYKGAFPYREFSILAAVNAIIGSKDFPVKVSRARIIAAAMGYKSIGMMTPEALIERKDGQHPLTVAQLRVTLDNMEARGLFARIPCANRRGMLFSTRMSATAMREHVITHTEKRFGKIAGKAAADQAYLDRITAIKEGTLLKRLAPPADSHTIATQSPRDSHEDSHEIASLIKTSLSESLDQKHLIRNSVNNSAGAPCVSVDIEKLERLASKAEDLGTPEALKNAAGYRKRIEELKTASSEVAI